MNYGSRFFVVYFRAFLILGYCKNPISQYWDETNNQVLR